CAGEFGVLVKRLGAATRAFAAWRCTRRAKMPRSASIATVAIGPSLQRRARRAAAPDGGHGQGARLRRTLAQDRSLDHLVGAQPHRSRDGDAKRIRRLHVDHQVELRRLLDRKVGGLVAFQDLVHVLGRALKKVETVWAIAKENSELRPLPSSSHDRQALLEGEVLDALPVCPQRQAGNEYVGSLSDHAVKGALAIRAAAR